MKRKNRLTIGVLLLLLLTQGMPGCDKSVNRSDDTSASVYAPAASRDFGYVYQGQKLTHTFEIHNATDAPIPIGQIKSSCGCSSAVVSGNNIPARGVALVRTIVDTTGKGEHPFEVFVDIGVEHPIKVVRCSLRGNIVIPYPDRIEWGRLRIDETKRSEFYIKTLPDETLVISDCEYNDKRLDVTIASASIWRRRDVRKVSVQCLTNAFIGKFDETIVFKTNNPFRPTARVVVTGYVMGQIEMEPSAVSLGILKDHEQKQITIRVYSPYNTPFTIDEIRNPFPDNLTIGIVSNDEGTEWILTVVARGGFQKGKVTGELQMRTQSERGAADIRIGVFGIQR